MIPAIRIFSSTDDTPSPQFPVSIGFFRHWKNVTTFAFYFLGIERSGGATPKQVHALWDKLQMLRITTGLVFAEVVKNWNSLAILCAWNFADSSHTESVHSVGVSFISEKSVSKFVFGVSPIPTLCNWVNRYFGEKSFLVLFGKNYFDVFHYKIVAHRN